MTDEDIVPPDGYASTMESLWKDGLLNPHPDGQLLRKCLRSGRQVKSAAPRWGEIDRGDLAQDEDQGEDAFGTQDGVAQARTAAKGKGREDLDVGSDPEDPSEGLWEEAVGGTEAGFDQGGQGFSEDEDDPMALFPHPTPPLPLPISAEPSRPGKGDGRKGTAGGEKRKRSSGDDEEEDELEDQRPEQSEDVQVSSTSRAGGTGSLVPQVQVNFNSASILRQPSSSQEFVVDPASSQYVAETKRMVINCLTGKVPPLGSMDTHEESADKLFELLKGTVDRGEGNSCVIQGVKGSGKTTVRWANPSLPSLLSTGLLVLHADLF